MQLDGSDDDTDTDHDDYNDDDYEMAKEDEEKSDSDEDDDDDDDAEEEFEFRSSAPLRVFERGRLLYPKDGRGGRIPPKYTVEPRLGQDVSKTTKAVSSLWPCVVLLWAIMVGLTASCFVLSVFRSFSSTASPGCHPKSPDSILRSPSPSTCHAHLQSHSIRRLHFPSP